MYYPSLSPHQLAIKAVAMASHTHKFKTSATRIKTLIQLAQLPPDKIDSFQQFTHDLMNVRIRF